MADSEDKIKEPPSKGQWQNLGVDPALAKALTLRGFKTPTPIQRATLPHTLSLPPRDVLGMARTGSGKTLAYMLPLLQNLRHSRLRHTNSRAIILVPTRELALQVLKAGKDISRGLKVAGSDGKRPLKWAMIIGGDALDKQFAMMTETPDIIIATPGRFLHVIVEMKYSLMEMDTVVYDEADRLFELGFQVQLQEILSRLPTSRQSMLFSATLPSTVAEFAKAGLANPAVIRLDADVRINPDLTTYFFRVSAADKDAALIVMLELAKIMPGGDSATQPQSIVFVATKHHVEYLISLLAATGYAASHVYGSLDQTARQRQLQNFRDRKTSLLVVTDVAARGLDIPVMDHVINYDFPPNARVFVHRVGRTARGGRKGWAWSILDKDDLAYYADLQDNLQSAEAPVLHSIPRSSLDPISESLQALSKTTSDIDELRAVMRKGDSMYRRSRSKATAQGYKSARTLVAKHASVFPGLGNDDDIDARAQLLSSIDAFRPASTSISAVPTKIGGSKKRRLEAPPAAESAPTIRSARLSSLAGGKNFRDASFCLPSASTAVDEKMYSIVEPSAAQMISSSILDLQGDEAQLNQSQKASQLRWDRKTKKFKRDNNNDRGPMIKTESGSMLPASFDSGRYKEWRKHSRARITDQSSSARPVKHPDEKPTTLTANQVRNQRTLTRQRTMKNARPTRRKS